jgi:queuine/archaeosine tRNA-ribosyltransferase
MTPYGALEVQRMNSGDVPYSCECPYCTSFGEELWKNEKRLALHNLWMILHVLQEVQRQIEADTLFDYLQGIIEIHQQWFPQSQLARSWDVLCGS